MPTTPETLNYLLMGLAVVFGFSGVFIASVYTRFQSLNKDIETLKRIQNEE